MRPLLAIALSLALAAPSVAQQKGRKVALLVGVSSFKHNLADLGGIPDKDVEKLGGVLKGNGFAVHTLTGQAATKKEIEAKFKALCDGGGDPAKALGKGDVILVQMCMHGFTLEVNGKKEPYLAGYDGRQDAPATLVSLNDLIRTSAPFGATTYFLIDACREATDANRGVEGGRMTLPKNTAILFSCAEGQLAHQPDKIKQGLFTYAVLKALHGETGLDGEITWADLVSHVGKSFKTNEFKKLIPAGKPQTPQAVQGEIEDAELFSTKLSGRQAAPPAAPTTAEERARLLSDHKEVQRAFLDHADELDHCLRRLVPERAVAWKAASDAGDPLGHALYGLCAMQGIGHPQDEKLAHELFLKAAAANDSWAMLGLGVQFLLGSGVPQDYKQAMEWYTKSAKLGNHHAMNSIGYMHENALGVPEDDAEAAKWFLASSAKYPTGMFNLGRKYEAGQGVPKDFKKARELYTTAAGNGSAEAMHRLAMMNIFGSGAPKNDREAVRWLLLGRDAGHALSIAQLGTMHAEGRGGLAADPKKGAELYLVAARKGEPGAMNLIGDAHLDGVGVPKDDKKAYEWFRRAAAAEDAEGMFNVAFMYENGRGTDRNYRDAMVYYKKAAKGGFAPAFFSVGRMYANGRGVGKNDAEAVKWYRDGADRGHPAAMNNLGFALQKGIGTEKDEKQAVEWYAKAAAKGNTPSISNLGHMHEYGLGTPRDYAKAKGLYEQAAAKGDSYAMLRLGAMHEAGNGLPKDVAKAKAWYQKAADAGSEGAKKELERLGK